MQIGMQMRRARIARAIWGTFSADFQTPSVGPSYIVCDSPIASSHLREKSDLKPSMIALMGPTNECESETSAKRP